MNKSTRDWNALKSAPCMDCVAAGRDGIWPPVCMDFDHVPERGKKLGSVKDFLADPVMLAAEIAKCDLICANCHRVRTSHRGASVETRAKMKAAWARPETKAKMSVSAKARWDSPETRSRHSAATRAAMAEPDVRERFLEGYRNRVWDRSTKSDVVSAHKTMDLVVETLATEGPMTRPQIIDRLGIASTAIGNYLRRLVRDGRIIIGPMKARNKLYSVK